MAITKSLPRAQSPTHTPLLAKALGRFRSELKDNDDPILDVASVEELLTETKALEPILARNAKLSKSLNRLEPILSHINDFAAVIAVCSGADAKAAGLVWGSLRVILTLASPAGDTLSDVLDMLDELSLSLPRFRSYEENLPVNQGLESALLDVYTEMTCFCARTINYFRSNPHQQLIRFGWSNLNNDFKQTIKRLKSLSRIVDSEAEALRLQADSKKNTELLLAMDLLKTSSSPKEKLPCFYLPFGSDGQFFGRQEILQEVGEILNPKQGNLGCKSFALYGMGGVGKTKVAMQYVNHSRSKFDAMFWISADNSVKFTQSFLEISRRLGLSPNDDKAEDPFAAVSKVKIWLAETNCKWLLVFDNADDPNILASALPGSGTGSILITSRDPTATLTTSAAGIQVKPFDEELAVYAFLSLVGRNSPTESERATATNIIEALGGLPLAINQISGFIVQQRLALKDFLPLYERNSAKIDVRRPIRGDYAHTLSTVWELALSQLSGPSATLQKLLALFDPDKIYESILREGGEHVKNSEFDFFLDEMDFLDAKEALLKAALIDRSSEDATLKIHRLVQAAVMKRLTTDEKTKYFDQAIEILSNGFPNTWNTVTGHQFTAWSKCEKCLPHVNFLIAQSKKNKLQATDPTKFAELILRCCCCKYLYEREQYMQAKEFMETALQSLMDKHSLMYASAIMLDGLIELDLYNIKPALKSFQTALAIREKMMSPDDAFIASSLNAISLAYTELGDLEKAVEAGEKAIDIRLRTKSDRIGNSYSNMASTLLRMCKPDEAEEMLKRCPSLKDFTDETFLKTGNPRFSGDMMLLSRIRLQQGRLDEAIRLSSKALTFRRTLLGNRLKTCDAMYQLAVQLQARRDLQSSINLLEESIAITEKLPEAQGYLARSKFRLAQILEDTGDIERAKNCKDAAEEIRARISTDIALSEATADAYDQLVTWMLW